jgi:Fe2+ transport system protein FeoA
MTKPVPHRGAPNLFRVAELPRHSRAVVVSHETDPATAERLAALGLGVGASFTILQAGASPTVRVGESRIGLGPALAGAVRAVPFEP